MAKRIEWTLHLVTNGEGDPEFAWLSRLNDDDAQGFWVADADWGPFDTLLDVGHWLGRTVRQTARSAPV